MSKGYTLPTDVSRCHDAECPQHFTCARWVQRALPVGAYMPATTTLRLNGGCDYYREIEVGYAGYPGDKA